MIEFKSAVTIDQDTVTKTYSPSNFYNFSAELYGFSLFPSFSPKLYEASWTSDGGILVMEKGIPMMDFDVSVSLKWAPILWNMLYHVSEKGFMHGDAALWNVILTSDGVRLIDWENLKPSSDAYDLTGIGDGQSWWGTDHTISPGYHWGVSYEYGEVEL